MSSWLRHAALAALLSLTGCATERAQPDGTTAECPVCKHEGDLACLCVHVEPDAPSCTCAGKTYYFCSDECRADFLKKPERYLGK